MTRAVAPGAATLNGPLYRLAVAVGVAPLRV